MNYKPKNDYIFAKTMTKINIGHNLKIVLVIVAGIFLLNSTTYGIDLSNKTHLRVPFQDVSRFKEGLDELTRRKTSILAEPYVNYNKAVENIVNPENKYLVGAYGGSGVDASNVFRSTNATKVYFVDKDLVIIRSKLKEYLEFLKNNGWENLKVIDKKSLEGYKSFKYFYGYGRSKDLYFNTEVELLAELVSLGVTLQDITSISVSQDAKKQLSIKFNWAYDKDSPKEEREIVFIEEDITELNELPEKIDFYYQKAGLHIPTKYPKFIHNIVNLMKPDAFMITDDYSAPLEFKPKHTRDDFVKNELEIDGFMLLEPSDDMDKWGKEIISLQDGKEPGSSRFYGWDISIRQKKVGSVAAEDHSELEEQVGKIGDVVTRSNALESI
jgi:hypothetical protein